MPREKKEFYCTECKKYFDFMLNLALNGNYRIHCPNCDHVHYRSVVDGNITEGRFTNDSKRDDILIEDIIPMPSSCRDKQQETEDYTYTGFMKRVWAEHFSGRL
jgi:hypothetical protein